MEARNHASDIFVPFIKSISVPCTWAVFCTTCRTYSPLCNNVGAHWALVENQEAWVENLSLHLKALLLLFSLSVMSVSLWPHGLQHARLPCPSLSLRVCSNSCPLSWWCHPSISHPLLPPSPPALNLSQHQGLFYSQLFTSGGQGIGASATASVLPVSIQGLFPFGLTGLISLQSQEFSRVFSNTTIWKYQFFSIQPSLWSNSHVCTWLLEKP